MTLAFRRRRTRIINRSHSPAMWLTGVVLVGIGIALKGWIS